jgi:hydrogenase maturation protease
LAQADDIPDAIFLDGGTLSFTLAGHIAESPCLIVVDAAAMGTPPGTVRVLEGGAMDRQLSGKGTSVHEVSLMDLLDMARLTDSLPRHRALVAIEPAEVDWGDQLTPAVVAAVPKAMAEVRGLVARWQSQPATAAAGGVI